MEEAAKPHINRKRTRCSVHNSIDGVTDMTKSKFTLTAAALIASAGLSTPAMAFEAGDMFVRFGATTVAPDESNDSVSTSGGTPLADTNDDVHVDDNTQLGITFTYMFSPNLGLEVLAATPFEHDISVKDGTLSSLGLDDVATVNHLPPTISAVYYFPTGDFMPYVGAGLNYTTFFDEEADDSLGAGADVELDDSWGIALQAGFDMFVGENWMLNASVRWIDISTDAEIYATTDAGGALTPPNTVKTTVDIDPWVYTVGVGYKF